MSLYIAKKDLLSWLASLAKGYNLVAPVQVAEDVVLFQSVSRVEDILLDYQSTVNSVKEFFFPLSEPLFTVGKKDGRFEVTSGEVKGETVLFGLHPCDAQGIAVLDKPYLMLSPADALYKQRREGTTLVGLACNKAAPECFCTGMGTSPADSSNLDILLTCVEDGYLVQTVTEKGKALFKGAAMKESSQSLPPTPPVPPVPTERIVEAMRRVFEAPYWSRLADRCIHCNICAYVCPVCYCFDIRDFPNQGKTERIRSWESCQSSGFTKIAGGYDPRASKGARMRQRFYHKLLYMQGQLGVLGCTGCGRCVRSCPVNIDIREIIADVQKLGGSAVGTK